MAGQGAIRTRPRAIRSADEEALRDRNEKLRAEKTFAAELDVDRLDEERDHELWKVALYRIGAEVSRVNVPNFAEW
jgi:hypothetical protein